MRGLGSARWSALLLLLLLAAHAQAATSTWDGGGLTSNWTEATNWG
jgi:hypothetical protein